MAKIKLPKKPCGIVIFLTKIRKSYQDLGAQADPMIEN